ncbi:hypothetical protein M9458_003520, partial [Cirrhinus mrigala]
MWCCTKLNFVFTNRSFVVEIEAFSSATVPISCGVPQGSILGPILFSLCIFLLLHDTLE